MSVTDLIAYVLGNWSFEQVVAVMALMIAGMAMVALMRSGK